MPRAQHALRRFSLYAVAGRIYVQNSRSFLIDIGEYELTDDGFAYRIAGDTHLSGDGFAGADDVLRDLSARIDAAFLDIRFRTLPDQSEDYSVDLQGAAHRELRLSASQADGELRDSATTVSVSGQPRYSGFPGR